MCIRDRRSIPFNTAYKYSAKDFGAQGCYVVGAPDVLAGARAGEFADKLTPLLAEGRRVLLLAKYNAALPNPPAALDAAQLEFLALLPVQNRIRASAPKTFRYFAKQGVAVKVISGDDPQAVSHVAATAAVSYTHLGGGGLRVFLRGLGLAGGGQRQQVKQGVARYQNVEVFDRCV